MCFVRFDCVSPGFEMQDFLDYIACGGATDRETP